jgi:hypothetical protein
MRGAAASSTVWAVDDGMNAHADGDVLGGAAGDDRDDADAFVEFDDGVRIGHQLGEGGLGRSVDDGGCVHGAVAADRGQLERRVQAAGAPWAWVVVPGRAARAS